MASFFKRGSKSRSGSYTDEDYEKPAIPERGGGGYEPPSSYKANNNLLTPTQTHHQSQDQSNGASSIYTSNGRSESSYSNIRTTSASNIARSNQDGYVDINPNAPVKQFAAPDLLTLAFNEAIRPHTEKIELLERQLAEMQIYVDQLEQHRLDIHNWIDKRGLRPGTPRTTLSPSTIHSY